MKVVKRFSGLTSLGSDWRSGTPFTHVRVDEALARAFVQSIGMSSSKIHDLTCSVKKFHVPSLLSQEYTTEKVIKFKATLIVEAELIDNVQISFDKAHSIQVNNDWCGFEITKRFRDKKVEHTR